MNLNKKALTKNRANRKVHEKIRRDILEGKEHEAKEEMFRKTPSLEEYEELELTEMYLEMAEREDYNN